MNSCIFRLAMARIYSNCDLTKTLSVGFLRKYFPRKAMQRTILHIDMDAYFASVEQKTNPHLKGKPIAVCGEGRTVIATASYEARKYGVKTAMPLYKAKKLCPFLITVPGNYSSYLHTTLEIHKILLEFTNQEEGFSIDECFLDNTHSKLLFGDGITIAKKIMSKIK